VAGRRYRCAVCGRLVCALCCEATCRTRGQRSVLCMVRDHVGVPLLGDCRPVVSVEERR
jgi:hypothetical protein